MSQHPKLRKTLLTSAFGTAVLLALLLVTYLTYDYQRTLREAESQLREDTRSISEMVETTFRAGNVALVATRQIVQERGGLSAMSEEAVHQIFMRQLNLLTRETNGVAMHAMFAVQADGKTKASSVSFPTKIVNSTDRDYFKYFSSQPTPSGSYISALSISRLTGLPVIFMTTAVKTNNGQFDGVIGISLRLRAFEEFFRQHSPNPDRIISIWRQDGRPVFRYPMVPEFEHAQGTDLPDFARMVSLRDGVLRTPLAAEAQHTAFGMTAQFPLLTTVSTQESTLLAPWRENLVILLLAYLVTLSIALILLRTTLNNVVIASQEASANLAKSRFLANISHELRTPLNGILGMAELLAMPGIDDQERRDFAAAIRDSGKRLLTLVNNILDLTQIESRALALHPEPIDPEHLLQEVIARHASLAKEKGLELNAQWQGKPLSHHLVDAERVYQMLGHLVSNALKHTAQGAIRINCKPLVLPRQRNMLEFSVTDTGSGISAEHDKDLLQAFNQGNESRTRTEGGAGLGLAIVRSLAEAMGGSIGYSNVPEQGARFWFRIEAPLMSDAIN